MCSGTCLAGRQGFIIFSLALSCGNYSLQVNYSIRHLCWIRGQKVLEQKWPRVLESRNSLVLRSEQLGPINTFSTKLHSISPTRLSLYLTNVSRVLGDPGKAGTDKNSQISTSFAPLSLSFFSGTLHMGSGWIYVSVFGLYPCRQSVTQSNTLWLVFVDLL